MIGSVLAEDTYSSVDVCMRVRRVTNKSHTQDAIGSVMAEDYQREVMCQANPLKAVFTTIACACGDDDARRASVDCSAVQPATVADTSIFAGNVPGVMSLCMCVCM